MGKQWVTCGTPTVPAVVNTLTAACDRGYVPDQFSILSNPGIEAAVDRTLPICREVVDAYDGALDITREHIDDETDFAAIVAYYQSAIADAEAADDEIAIDVTPGRKFMSAISFQVGMTEAADHVFYFHRKSGPYEGQFYPAIPRTATDLIDFTEVI